jgi:hypothetical protein
LRKDLTRQLDASQNKDTGIVAKVDPTGKPVLSDRLDRPDHFFAAATIRFKREKLLTVLTLG